MTTQSQDYFVKHIESNDDHLYTVLYDSVTGDPFRIKTEMAGHYLSKLKKKSKKANDNMDLDEDDMPEMDSGLLDVFSKLDKSES